jgi:hypothetical protein
LKKKGSKKRSILKRRKNLKQFRKKRLNSYMITTILRTR